ncbi:hypothetical protein TWF128_010813 [Orbilia oligospora]|nr:hypothetical protein TWF128_010813 [Orbilia oligospora]
MLSEPSGIKTYGATISRPTITLYQQVGSHFLSISRSRFCTIRNGNIRCGIFDRATHLIRAYRLGY